MLSKLEQDLLSCLIGAVEGSGFSVSGPTHPDVAASEGEPRWVANAREAISNASQAENK